MNYLLSNWILIWGGWGVYPFLGVHYSDLYYLTSFFFP